MMGPQYFQINFAGISVGCRAFDCYIHASAICKAHGREFKVYKRQAQEFLTALSDEMQMDVEHSAEPKYEADMVLLDRDYSNGDNRGFWIHPAVAVDLAQWISIEYKIKFIKCSMEAFAFSPVFLPGSHSDDDVLNAFIIKMKKVLERANVVQNLRNTIESRICKMDDVKLRKLQAMIEEMDVAEDEHDDVDSHDDE